MKSKHPFFWRKFGRVVGLGTLFIVCCTAIYLGTVRLFAIRTIVVVGNLIDISVDESRLPKTLLLFPSAKMRAELLSQNPVLSDIQFQKKYPHTLVIIPTIRTPVARLQLTDREVLIDKNALVLSDADASSAQLPMLNVPIAVARIGEVITDPRVAAGLSFIQQTKDILPIRSVSVEDESSLRAKGDTVDILFPQDGQIPAIVTTLQTLMSGFRIKGTLPAVIDLRYNKPIIKF